MLFEKRVVIVDGNGNVNFEVLAADDQERRQLDRRLTVESKQPWRY